MHIHVFNYRHAEEILRHPRNDDAWREIFDIVANVPLFLHSNKGKAPGGGQLDVEQRCMNTYFDRLFAVERDWEFHPLATLIEDSGLAADYRKSFQNIRIQVEVQFGNASRLYADVFKFQAAFSQDVVDLGLCVIPMASLAKRMGQNIVSFERVTKELKAAKSFLTLPILVLGIEPNDETSEIDIRQSSLPLTSKGTVKLDGDNAYRITNAVFDGLPVSGVMAASPIGPKPGALVPLEPEEEADRGED